MSVGRDNASEANGLSTYPSISSTGRFVAFTSVADNLVAGDANKTPDVFVRDRPPRIEASPNPVDFGSAPLGSLGTTRPATDPEHRDHAGTDRDDHHRGRQHDGLHRRGQPVPARRSPGATCEVQVLFIGTAKGNRTATLAIRSDAGARSCCASSGPSASRS